MHSDTGHDLSALAAAAALEAHGKTDVGWLLAEVLAARTHGLSNIQTRTVASDGSEDENAPEPLSNLVAHVDRGCVAETLSRYYDIVGASEKGKRLVLPERVTRPIASLDEKRRSDYLPCAIAMFARVMWSHMLGGTAAESGETPSAGRRPTEMVAFDETERLESILAQCEEADDRLVIALPYTAECTRWAEKLREARPGARILEHHTGLKSGGDAGKADASLYDTWNADIVVTTTTRLTRIFYGTEPADGRKFASLIGATIVVDDLWCAHPALQRPLLAALEALEMSWGTKAIVSSRSYFPTLGMWPFGSAPRLVASDAERSGASVRGTMTLFQHGIGLADVAKAMARAGVALCIVNSRKSARELYRLLESSLPRMARGVEEDDRVDGLYHISAMMAPAHRDGVYAEIERRLAEGLPCYVVATASVEAGHVLSFPMVIRELGPMEALVRAESMLAEHGTLVVFDGTDDDADAGKAGDGDRSSTSSLGQQCRDTARMMRRRPSDAPTDMLAAYQIERRRDAGETDIWRHMTAWRSCSAMLPDQVWEDILELYRSTWPALVPWDDDGASRQRGIWGRTVDLERHELDAYERSGMLSRNGGLFVLHDPDEDHPAYSEALGLAPPPAPME